MKFLVTSYFLFIFSFTLNAQNKVEKLVQKGIEYHDNGEYKKAIDTYKEALIFDPKSTLINYEMALTYMNMGDYEKSIEHADIVLKQNEQNMIEAYVVKGSALDVMGKTKQSIKVFEKAIKKTEGHYLIYYNLAINYFNMNEIEKAEENIFNALLLNPEHPSSHLMLAKIHDTKKNAVKSILASHFFLFLEPNTKRSIEGNELLQNNFGGNVTTDEEEPNTINILLSLNDTKEFGAAELMVSMLSASNKLEKNRDKTEDELFVENTASFFKMLGELNKEKEDNFWWNFYIPFFYDLANSAHLETYCKYITQSVNSNSEDWLSENPSKLDELEQWLMEE